MFTAVRQHVERPPSGGERHDAGHRGRRTDKLVALAAVRRLQHQLRQQVPAGRVQRRRGAQARSQPGRLFRLQLQSAAASAAVGGHHALVMPRPRALKGRPIGPRSVCPRSPTDTTWSTK